ncbi:MAG: hypothetical protein KAW46_06210, partial [candidate division Zixibacteria bacterium]|nr:hypothetical protein [candidate division Zixibacteria bacterium]
MSIAVCACLAANERFTRCFPPGESPDSTCTESVLTEWAAYLLKGRRDGKTHQTFTLRVGYRI